MLGERSKVRILLQPVLFHVSLLCGEKLGKINGQGLVILAQQLLISLLSERCQGQKTQQAKLKSANAKHYKSRLHKKSFFSLFRCKFFSLGYFVSSSAAPAAGESRYFDGATETKPVSTSFRTSISQFSLQIHTYLQSLNNKLLFNGQLLCSNTFVTQFSKNVLKASMSLTRFFLGRLHIGPGSNPKLSSFSHEKKT